MSLFFPLIRHCASFGKSGNSAIPPTSSSNPAGNPNPIPPASEKVAEVAQRNNFVGYLSNLYDFSDKQVKQDYMQGFFVKCDKRHHRFNGNVYITGTRDPSECDAIHEEIERGIYNARGEYKMCYLHGQDLSAISDHLDEMVKRREESTVYKSSSRKAVVDSPDSK